MSSHKSSSEAHDALRKEVGYNTSSGYPFWAWLQEKGTKVDFDKVEPGKSYILMIPGQTPAKVVVEEKKDEMVKVRSPIASKNLSGKTFYLVNRLVSREYANFYEMQTKKGGKHRVKKTRKASRKGRKGTYRKCR